MRDEHAEVMAQFKTAADTLKNDMANLKADNKKAMEEIKTNGKENSDTIIKINETLKGIEKNFAEQDKKYQKDIKELEATIAKISVMEKSEDLSKNLKVFNKVLKSHNKAPIAIESMNEIKEAFDTYITKGKDRMSDAQIKFVNTIIDSDGGFLVVPEYNNVMVSKSFDSHGFMGIVNSPTVGTNEWKTIIDWEDYDESFYENELVETTGSDSQDFKEVTINTPQQIYSKKFSRNALEDSMINVETEVLDKMRRGMIRKDGGNLITGLGGTSGIRGALTYANGTTYGTVEQVAGVTATGQVGWMEVLKTLPSALKDDYHANASYVMQRATFFSILADKSGSNDFQIGSQINFFDKSGVSMRLLGYPVVWESSMESISASSKSIMFGDMKEFYTYAKRVGISIIRDETNPRYILLHLRQRAGGNIVNFEAAKILVTKS